LGAKVTVVEALPAILPGTDPELGQVVARKLKKLGVEVMTGAKAKSWTEKGGKAAVTLDIGGEEGAGEGGKGRGSVGPRPERGEPGTGRGRREDRARLRADRSAHAHQRARHLRDRRPRRPAHAGAQGVARGRGRRRGHRGPQVRDGRANDPRGDLQRSGDRV